MPILSANIPYEETEAYRLEVEEREAPVIVSKFSPMEGVKVVRLNRDAATARMLLTKIFNRLFTKDANHFLTMTQPGLKFRFKNRSLQTKSFMAVSLIFDELAPKSCHYQVAETVYQKGVASIAIKEEDKSTLVEFRDGYDPFKQTERPALGISFHLLAMYLIYHLLDAGGDFVTVVETRFKRELRKRREQVKQLYQEGLTDLEIANKLGYSEKTVQRDHKHLALTGEI